MTPFFTFFAEKILLRLKPPLSVYVGISDAVAWSTAKKQLGEDDADFQELDRLYPGRCGNIEARMSSEGQITGWRSHPTASWSMLAGLLRS